MRGLAAFAVLCLAVSAYAQMPRTQTKKGQRPSRRRGDNPDIGMPSGKDVPDGRRFVPNAAPVKPAPRPVAQAMPVAPPAKPAARPNNPTVIKSGTKPAPRPVGRPVGRPSDNPDFGMPSGADVPDGRRMAPPQARPMAPVANPTVIKSGPKPAARPVGRPTGRPSDNPDFGMPSGADVPDGRRMAPPPARPMTPVANPTVIKSGPKPAARPVGRPAGRPSDNPDFGMPSGADVPDGRRMASPPTMTRSGPAPPRKMRPAYRVAAPAPPSPPKPQPVYNPWAAFFAPALPAPVAPMPAAPMAPLSCEAQCPYGWSPVCSVYGNSYDTYCRLKCSGEPYDCEGQCPCEEPNVAPQSSPFDNPYVGFSTSCNCDPFEDNPVCTEDGEQYNNRCMADCEGKTIACSSNCPC